MALPKIETPTYELTLYSSGEKVKYRPFLVKEQKILLMAVEEGTPEALVSGIAQIVENCTFEKINAKQIPLFDIENLFLRMREKSVGEVAEFRVKCVNDSCSGITQVSVPLEDIVPNKDPVGTTIKLTDSLFLNMRYPTLDSLTQVKDLNNVDDNFTFLMNCIESIEHNGSIIDMSTTSKEDLQEFVENMTQEQFGMVKSFFYDMPKMSYLMKYTCSACGTDCEREISGLQNFLA